MGEPQIFDMIYELAHVHIHYSVRECGEHEPQLTRVEISHLQPPNSHHQLY